MPRSFTYSPNQAKSFPLSRTKIELFMNCPRCFWLDRVKGIKRPSGPPFTINSAVDFLLKKEFDVHRAANTPHPLMKAYGISATPFAHKQINKWRENFHGVRVEHKLTNLTIFGAVDDVWCDENNKLIVVDYKATAKTSEVNLDADWQISYKRQMEVYQWLLRQNGFEVSDTGYFVYCNGNVHAPSFDGKIEFNIKVIPYVGNDSWIEPTLLQLKNTLDNDAIPPQTKDCEYCLYIQRAADFKQHDTSSQKQQRLSI